MFLQSSMCALVFVNCHCRRSDKAAGNTVTPEKHDVLFFAKHNATGRSYRRDRELTHSAASPSPKSSDQKSD